MRYQGGPTTQRHYIEALGGLVCLSLLAAGVLFAVITHLYALFTQG